MDGMIGTSATHCQNELITMSYFTSSRAPLGHHMIAESDVHKSYQILLTPGKHISALTDQYLSCRQVEERFDIFEELRY